MSACLFQKCALGLASPRSIPKPRRGAGKQLSEQLSGSPKHHLLRNFQIPRIGLPGNSLVQIRKVTIRGRMETGHINKQLAQKECADSAISWAAMTAWSIGTVFDQVSYSRTCSLGWLAPSRIVFLAPPATK
jgi:hypothetical protein